MELDQKSTCSLREPTFNKQESEGTKSKSKQNQKNHLVDLSDVPEEMRSGQLFLQ